MSVHDVQLIVIFLLYGGAFLVMAWMLWAGIERTAKLGIAAHLNILIFFALIHGVSDLVDAVLRVPGVPASPDGPVAAIRLVLLALSFVALLWFGAAVLIDDRRAFQAFMALGILASVGVAAGLAALFADRAAVDSVQTAERAARLVLGLPGGLLAALAFLKVSRRCNLLGLEQCSQGALVAAVSMAVYAIFAGAVATGYPQAVFILGLPVQLYRMMAAITITVGCVVMLRGLALTD